MAFKRIHPIVSFGIVCEFLAALLENFHEGILSIEMLEIVIICHPTFDRTDLGCDIEVILNHVTIYVNFD